jgi:hypothetical protein
MNVRTLVLLVALVPGIAAAQNAPDVNPDVAKPTIDATSASNPTTDTVPPDGKAGHPDIANPAIDMGAYLRVSMEAAAYRQSHRVSEEDFLRMSLPDITVDSLKQTIPDKSTRVLIYCNNNFTGALKPFPTKLPSASLNLSTYIALYNYGYRNVYELGPLIDVKASKLVFEGTE